MSGWAALFLATTILMSVTGFLFPGAGFTPAQGIGFLSIAVLAVTLLALSLSQSLALDLCGWRGPGPLPECLRRSRAGFLEAVVPAVAGADAVGTALHRCSDRRSDDLRGAWPSSGEKVSSGACRPDFAQACGLTQRGRV
jgi:hypothetical protein